MASKAQLKMDEYFMRMALGLAMNGTGSTSPNPRVGCVIVRDGQLLSTGWHHICGGPHAEVDAVTKAAGDVKGSTVYVNLEPCCHYGKTPPCAQMLIEHGVARVVAGMTDPNPAVDCRGLRLLESAGIEVTAGVLDKECRWINRGFIRRMLHSRPWVTIKTASSLDGNIALRSGSGKWITGMESREKVHMLRAENDAVLTGVGTVIADDPELTVRSAPGATPLRVVLDGGLGTPPEAKILKGGNVLFFVGDKAPADKIKYFESLGAVVEIIDAPREKQIGIILQKLCKKGVNYLMVEAGAGVTSSFLASGYADELSMFIAPKLMGNGLRYTEHLSFDRMEDSLTLKHAEYAVCGEDIWVKGVLSCSPDL